MRKIITSLLSFFLIAEAHAVDLVPYIIQPRYTIGVPTSSAVLIAGIIKYGIGLAGILGVIGVTWGGIQMILSVGEDEKQKKARYIIIYSLVGVAVAGFAYSIVTNISSIK